MALLICRVCGSSVDISSYCCPCCKSTAQLELEREKERKDIEMKEKENLEKNRKEHDQCIKCGNSGRIIRYEELEKKRKKEDTYVSGGGRKYWEFYYEIYKVIFCDKCNKESHRQFTEIISEEEKEKRDKEKIIEKRKKRDSLRCDICDSTCKTKEKLEIKYNDLTRYFNDDTYENYREYYFFICKNIYCTKCGRNVKNYSVIDTLDECESLNPKNNLELLENRLKLLEEIEIEKKNNYSYGEDNLRKLIESQKWILKNKIIESRREYFNTPEGKEYLESPEGKKEIKRLELLPTPLEEIETEIKIHNYKTSINNYRQKTAELKYEIDHLIII